MARPSLELELRIWGRGRSSGYGNGAGGGLEADTGDVESLLLIRRGSTTGASFCLPGEFKNNSPSG